MKIWVMLCLAAGPLCVRAQLCARGPVRWPENVFGWRPPRVELPGPSRLQLSGSPRVELPGRSERAFSGPEMWRRVQTGNDLSRWMTSRRDAVWIMRPDGLPCVAAAGADPMPMDRRRGTDPMPNGMKRARVVTIVR